LRDIKKIDGYEFTSSEPCCSHSYLLPTVVSALQEHFRSLQQSKRIFDLGCGNGAIGNELHKLGYDVYGVDPSKDGIEHANASYPTLKLSLGSAYDKLDSTYGTFPAVISLEVVEHVYSPRDYAKTLYSLVSSGGIAIISTPYYGYLKNLALSITGKMDEHFTALWDHGHIKFWSPRTLKILLREAGFTEIQFHRVGRIPALAKSMIAVAKKQT
jgi:2-polyprenyl-3-methyl-5-hydroxy-6-metoxy-1,4-benzoquinol methylase